MSMDARYRYSQSYAANASIQVPPPTMTSQRFCLRWNNHQSNLLSVFDQLLHDESFVDVTIGVEGQYLKAHKMVLSACSPYFQALFVSTPDKHPIVILKDVPYADMRSLLDFMYRGEVSVDQDRLTAFLRVAENLRIKGLTEVNEDKCDIPSITSSLLSGNGGNNNNNVQNTMSHSSHRMPPAPPRRPAGQLMSPLLGNALAQPKRKRGRPRKLSGSSNGAPSLDAEGSPIVRGSPEMLEVKMNMDGFQGSESDIKRDTDVEGDDGNEIDDKSDIQKENQEQPVAGTSREQEGYHNNEFHADSPNDQKLITPKMEATHHTPQTLLTQQHRIPMAMDGVSNYQTTVSGQSLSTVHTSTSDNINNNNPNLTTSVASTSNAPTSGRQPIRRRARRRATSASQDPAEQLTEMSVRGLNLFRYASVNEGIYQCTECAKVDVQKTFKNKYSFQRHAFLYHEGHQRKVFPCPVCGKEFSRPDKMKNHMKTVHDCFMPKDCVFPVNFFVNP